MHSNLATKLFAARGPLALMGIVLHLCTFYHPINPFPVSREHHWLTIAISDLIHSFRMEAFMLIAGVTFAILIKKHSQARFFLNRVKRLLLPFVLTAAFVNYPVYLLYADSGSGQILPLLEAPRKAIVMHLWFLRDLFLITTLASLLYFSTPKVISRNNIRIFCQTHQVLIISLLPLFLTIPRALGFMFPIISIESATFGSIENILRYAIFFFLGTFSLYMPIIGNSIDRPSRKGILIALMVFSLAWTFSQFSFENIFGKATAYASKQTCTLIMIALVLQFCYRSCNLTKRLLPSLDRASYSIYLLHLPLLILVANAVGTLKLPIWIDWTIIFGVTTILCLYFFRISEQLKGSSLFALITFSQSNQLTHARD